ncbi:hypothetical protein DL96DRAFT_1513527, partial [Flagelloscypha sp. PMI_526]
MTSSSPLTNPTVMAKPGGALSTMNSDSSPAVVAASRTIAAGQLGVPPENFEPISPNSVKPGEVPSMGDDGIPSQSLGGPLKLNDTTPSPNETWHQDVLQLLRSIKDELSAEKSSKSNPVLPASSKDTVLSVHLPENVRQEEARRLFGVLSQVDSVKSTGGKSYNYEEKYPEDAPGEELGADGRIFKVYNDEAEKYDADMIRGFRDSLDGLLVFASLFSAVVTTFLMQTIQILPTDQSRITNYLLYETSLCCNLNSVSKSPYGPDSNTYGNNDLWINGLFIASLALSLTTALLSVLAKQWLQAYTAVTSGSARDVALIRHLRFTGLEQWKMHEIIGILPLILHTSLGLFFAGLFVFI